MFNIISNNYRNITTYLAYLYKKQNSNHLLFRFFFLNYITINKLNINYNL